MIKSSRMGLYVNAEKAKVDHLFLVMTMMDEIAMNMDCSPNKVAFHRTEEAAILLSGNLADVCAVAAHAHSKEHRTHYAVVIDDVIRAIRDSNGVDGNYPSGPIPISALGPMAGLCGLFDAVRDWHAELENPLNVATRAGVTLAMFYCIPKI